MPKDDWYRRKTWTQEDRDAFLTRNRRSRTAVTKAQYVRIQAETLLQTGNVDLAKAALELLHEHYFPEHRDSFDATNAWDCAARCSEAVGDQVQAIQFYQRALACEANRRNVRSGAAYGLARLAVESNRRDLLDQALSAIERFGHTPFPWHAYVARGAMAFRAASDGDPEAARKLARAALEAASISDTGLSQGRGHLGTVSDTDTLFHQVVVQLAGEWLPH